MKKSSKNVLAIIISIVLVVSMATDVMISAFADNAALTAEPTTAEETEPEVTETEAPAEETTVAPVSEETTAAEETEPEATETEAPEESTTENDGDVVGIVGDVSSNGKVNSADARLALRICARLDTPDELDLVEADANGDKYVKSSDARIILRYAARLEKPDDGNILLHDILLRTVKEDGLSVVYEAR